MTINTDDPVDPKLTFETHMREVVSKAARNLGALCRAGKLFNFLRVLKGCFNAYALYSLEYCGASVWMSSAESHLGLLDSSVLSAERLSDDELCCLGHS